MMIRVRSGAGVPEPQLPKQFRTAAHNTFLTRVAGSCPNRPVSKAGSALKVRMQPSPRSSSSIRFPASIISCGSSKSNPSRVEHAAGHQQNTDKEPVRLTCWAADMLAAAGSP